MPFTIEQFLGVFKNYNLAVWPMQLALYLMGVFMVLFGTQKAPASNKAISYMLAFLWFWMGLIYHLAFFTSINKGAYLFGTLFMVQGVLFLAYNNKLSFRFQRNTYGIAGAFFMLFAMVMYPVWGYFAGHIYPSSPTFGLPCPTTIFTLGMLLWAYPKPPIYLLAIPFLWSLIGFSAALSLGIVEDTGLFMAGIVTAFLRFRQRQSKVM